MGGRWCVQNEIELAEHKRTAQRAYETIQHDYKLARQSRIDHPTDPNKWITTIVFDFEQKRVVPNLRIKQTLFKDQLYVGEALISFIHSGV
jgi:hypothetical protein